ncbi:hypothetical protein AVEN_105919-1 [Araneus ventricosus]|uniref:Mariner Mos1 transposase n=1 Tax=Araneus ventricosus TaxID=182803 RepID=A0A4Y2SFX0_ARAVE|nr:hypothetical protein AVEN_105919-1 [Araneus ventricosus]
MGTKNAHGDPQNQSNGRCLKISFPVPHGWGRLFEHDEFMTRGTTINSEVYCRTLKKLKRAIQNKRRSLLSSGVVLLHDNARPHTAVRTGEFYLGHCKQHEGYFWDGPRNFDLWSDDKDGLLLFKAFVLRLIELCNACRGVVCARSAYKAFLRWDGVLKGLKVPSGLEAETSPGHRVPEGIEEERRNNLFQDAFIYLDNQS